MTNEEKAKELTQYYSQESDYKESVGYDCAISMAEWKEKQVTEKACEWLEDNLTYYISVEPRGFEGYKLVIEKDDFLTDFKKAMEE